MTPSGLPTKILLVEDHQKLRRGIRVLLEGQRRYAVCGEAATVAEALNAARETSPHLAIVDLSLKHGNGLDLIGELKRQLPGIAVLVLSMHSAHIYAGAALQAGASGYLMKVLAPECLLEAIDCILSGGVWLNELPTG